MPASVPAPPADPGTATPSDGRSTLSVVLFALAGLAIVGALVTTYLRTQILDGNDFSQRAVEAVQRDEVRQVVARQITVNVVERGAEDAITYRPIVEQAVSIVLDTPPARKLVGTASRELHRLLFVRDRGNVVLDIADAATVIRPALRSVAPQVADEIPSDLSPEVLRLREGQAGTKIVRVSRNVRLLSYGLPILALLLLIGAIAVAGDRRTAATRAGIAVGVAGVVVVGLALIGKSIVVGAAVGGPVIDGESARSAVGALWDVMVGDLRRWGLLFGAAGLIVAGAGASLLRPVEAAGDRLERAVAELWSPRTPELRGLRGVVAIILGSLLLVRPELAARLIALGAGAFLAFVGAGEVLDLVQEPRRRAQARAAGVAVSERRGRTLVPVAAVAVTLLALVAVVGSALLSDDTPADASTPPPLPKAVTACNGSAALCDRRINDVVFAGTHNSFSAAEDPGWTLTNQRFGVARQLRDGIRLFLLDLHPGIRTASGRVRTDFRAAGSSENRVRQELDPAQQEALDRLSGRFGLSSSDPGVPGAYFCHGACELGSTKAVDVLRQIKTFLDQNPGEVVVLVIEPYVSASEVAAVYKEAGLLDRVATLARDEPLPTLRELIASKRTLVTMTERGATPEVPWYMDAFSFVQDTPLGAQAGSQFSCARYRGEESSPMLMLNHWIDTFPPPRGRNRPIQTRDFIVDRALTCGRQRGLPVGMIAVDHYDLGDVVGAVEQLNAMPVERRTAVPADDDAVEAAVARQEAAAPRATPVLEAGGRTPTAGVRQP